MYRGWVVTLAGLLINFLAGIIYTWSIIAGALVREMGWSFTEAALPYTIFLFSYAPSMALAGRIQDKIGPRPVLTAGGILLGGSTILSSFLITPLSISILWGIFWGLGMACTFATVTPAAIKWFPVERKGLITGIVVFGMGLSGFILAPLINYSLSTAGLQFTFLSIGFLLLFGIVLLSRLIENPPLPLNLDNTISKTNPARLPLEIFRLPQFYLLWLIFCLITGVGVTFATHMDTIARSQFGFTEGFIIVSLFSFFNAWGRILAGVLFDSLGRVWAMLIMFMAMALVLVNIISFSAPLNLAIAVSVIGLTYGGLFGLIPATVSAFFGEKNFGFFYGLIFTGIAVGGLFPLLAGYLFELRGDFTLVFIVLLAATLLAVLLSIMIKKPTILR